MQTTPAKMATTLTSITIKNKLDESTPTDSINTEKNNLQLVIIAGGSEWKNLQPQPKTRCDEKMVRKNAFLASLFFAEKAK